MKKQNKGKHFFYICGICCIIFLCIFIGILLGVTGNRENEMISEGDKSVSTEDEIDGTKSMEKSYVLKTQEKHSPDSITKIE